jgi:general secretion pathway protein F
MRLGDATVTTALLQASDEDQIRATLTQEGQTVLTVQAIRPRIQWKTLLRGKSLAAPSYSLFCREVRTLIAAGMTIVEAAETLSARERLEGKGDSLAAQLLDRLQQGMALSTAMGELPSAPPVLIAAVRAGERTSNLGEALDDYLRFDSLVSQLKKKVVSAAIYPGLVTLIGISISLFLLLVVMPKFAVMYENLRSNTEGSIALTIQISRVIGNHQTAVFCILGLLMSALAYWIYSGLARKHVVQLVHAVPWARARMEDFQLAMMYQALALLLKGGYPMTSALQVAGQSALSPQLTASLKRVLDRIEQGSLVSQALAQEHLCDEVGRRLMAAAERNGNFHIATQVVSRLHGERFELIVERVTRIVEPLLLLTVALVVGGIVVMMYLPVFDMATQLR